MTKWDMFTSSHSTRFDPSANDFYFRAKTTFFGYKNPKMEALLDKASATVKFEERYKIYEEVQKLTYEDVAMLKLYDHYTWQGHSAKLKATPPGSWCGSGTCGGRSKSGRERGGAQARGSRGRSAPRTLLRLCVKCDASG